MRITIIFLLVAVAGTVFGAGFATWSFYQLPEQTSIELGLVVQTDPSEELPAVEVDEKEHDFGVMDSQATGTHAFVFRNVGKAPLKLEEGQTTCKCTLSDIGDGLIPPGGTGNVTLEWSGKTLIGPYTQTATIITNDPRNPTVELRIHGEMMGKARVIPSELVFSSVTAGQPAHGSVTLFCYLDEPLEITGYEIDDPQNVDVSFSPMSDDEVEREEYATCGQQMDVTIKPGLPPGPFKRRIRVQTSLEGFEEFIIPVEGTISSEISIFGAGWSPKTGVLRFGSLRNDEAVRKLVVKVGGLQPDKVNIEVAEVQPEFVIVRIGERTTPPGSPVAVTPIEIEIPKDSPPGNYLGPKNFGRIRFKTTHATVTELDIKLHFLIGG